MALSVVQNKTASDNGGTVGTISAAFTSNITAGNAILVIVSLNDSTAVLFNQELQPPTDTLGNKYYQIGNVFDATASVGIEAWIAYSSAGGANTVSIPNGSNDSATSVYELAGVPYFGLDQSVATDMTPANATFTTGNITTAIANALLMAGFVGGVSAWSAGTNYSNIHNQASTSNELGTEERTVSATGTYNATATHTSSAGACLLCAISDTASTTAPARITKAGATYNTTSGTHTVVATPAVGDLIVIVRASTGNAVSHAPTDNNADGFGTYSLAVNALRNTSADMLEIWVRNRLIGNAASTTFTEAPGTTTGGGLEVFRISGMKRAGSNAILQTASQANQAANATPAPTFTNFPLATNPIFVASANATTFNAGIEIVGPIGFVNTPLLGYSTPTSALLVAFAEGGISIKAQTFTAQSPTVGGSLAVELDASVPTKTQPAVSRIANTVTKTQTATASITEPISQLTDDFNDNSRDATKWDGFNHFAETNGELELTITSGESLYSGYDSHRNWDLTGSSVFVKIVDAGNQALTNYELFPVRLFDAGNVNSVFWYINQNTISVWKRLSSSNTQLSSASYVPATHTYLRIREASGTIFWDYSSDGTSWTNFFSVANPLPQIRSLQFEISAGTFSSAASSTLAKLDNLNVSSFTGTFTQSSIARVANNVTKTQGALARIAKNITKTQSSIARVATNPTKTQSAVARIANNKTKTQTAIASVKVFVSKTQTAIAHIASAVNKTQSATARIAKSVTKTQPSVARIANILTKTQSAIAKINQSQVKNQTAIARIQNIVTKTQSAIARIQNISTKAQSAVARIANNKTKTQPSIARIANIITKTQSAIGRIANNRTKTQTATARVDQSEIKIQTATARIQRLLTKTQSAISRIAQPLSKTQSATARIDNPEAKTQTAKARIANTLHDTQNAKARIIEQLTLNQSVISRISMNLTSSQTAKAHVVQSVNVGKPIILTTTGGPPALFDNPIHSATLDIQSEIKIL